MEKTKLLTGEEVAKILGIGRSTLNAWRYRGEGPKPIRLPGRFVRYSEADVYEWINNHRAG